MEVLTEIFQIILFYTEVNQLRTNNSEVNLMKAFCFFMDY